MANETKVRIVYLTKSLNRLTRPSTRMKASPKNWLEMLSNEKLKKCPWPVNCNKTIVPKVNPEVWGKLSKQVKGNNPQFSRLQTHLTKVGHIVVKSTDVLLKGKANSSKSYIDDLVWMNTKLYCLTWPRQFWNFTMSARKYQATPPQRLCRWRIASSTEPYQSVE